MNSFEHALIGEAAELKSQLRAASLLAATDVPVLIQGESGTGKDLLARAIHAGSPRAKAPFIAVNCAALPESLVESMLYGHRRGAFTGATEDRPGLVAQAAGGTLFLDEVGELPLAVQAKLLRFLESGECLPVGAERPLNLDVRVVAATNRDLAAAVKEGVFRSDLYYRLNVVPLKLPPLRERQGDVERLIDHFNRELAGRHGLEPPRYSRAALRLLNRYAWPGNVRELRNLVERLMILCGSREIGPENLPPEIRAGRPAGSEPPLVELPAGGVRLEEVEIGLIRQALAQAGGNRSQAARLLGLSRDTLLYRLKKYAILE